MTTGPGLTGRAGADPGPHPGIAQRRRVEAGGRAPVRPVTDELGPIVYAGGAVGAAEPGGARDPTGSAGASTMGARRLPRPDQRLGPLGL